MPFILSRNITEFQYGHLTETQHLMVKLGVGRLEKRQLFSNIYFPSICIDCFQFDLLKEKTMCFFPNFEGDGWSPRNGFFQTYSPGTKRSCYFMCHLSQNIMFENSMTHLETNQGIFSFRLFLEIE